MFATRALAAAMLAVGLSGATTAAAAMSVGPVLHEGESTGPTHMHSGHDDPTMDRGEMDRGEMDHGEMDHGDAGTGDDQGGQPDVVSDETRGRVLGGFGAFNTAVIAGAFVIGRRDRRTGKRSRGERRRRR